MMGLRVTAGGRAGRTTDLIAAVHWTCHCCERSNKIFITQQVNIFFMLANEIESFHLKPTFRLEEIKHQKYTFRLFNLVAFSVLDKKRRC